MVLFAGGQALKVSSGREIAEIARIIYAECAAPYDDTEIYTCVFASDGTRALTGSQGNPVTLWDLTSGKSVQNFEHDGPVWALAWSSDDRFLLSLDGSMRMWEVGTGKCFREFEGLLKGMLLALSPRCSAWINAGPFRVIGMAASASGI